MNRLENARLAWEWPGDSMTADGISPADQQTPPPDSTTALYEQLRRYRNLIFEADCYYSNDVLAEFARVRPTTKAELLVIDPSPEKFTRAGNEFIRLIKRHTAGGDQDCYPGWGRITADYCPLLASPLPAPSGDCSTLPVVIRREKPALEIIGNGVTEVEMVKWRAIIAMAYVSLPERERRVVPPFHLYRTLLKAMSETFDCDLRKFDDEAGKYLREKVWAFAYMDGEALRNDKLPADNYRQIVLMLDRAAMIPETMPVEFTVFHEIGHFVIRFIRNVVMTRRNETQVEYDADTYAFHAYARLLHRFPGYRSAVATRKQAEFESFIRGTAWRSFKKAGGMAPEDLYSEIAQALLKELNWRKMYQRMTEEQKGAPTIGEYG